MSTPKTHSVAIPSAPAWLARVYDYVGAHRNAHRYENERDRCWQRMAMPTASIAWIFVFHRIVQTPITSAEYLWSCAALAYAIAGGIFGAYLEKHPAGGIHAQYAFLALDPLIVGWALYAAPPSPSPGGWY